MRRFVRIEGGAVAELLPPADFPSELIPENGDIRTLYHPEFAVLLQEITDLIPQPKMGWSYKDGAFEAPVQYVPSTDEIHSANKMVRDQLLQTATLAIAPLQDAVDFGKATEAETELLQRWRQYRLEANRADLSVMSPDWPTFPA